MKRQDKKGGVEPIIKAITLYTSMIEDYDQTRKDYLEWCEDMDKEPKDDGEIDWFATQAEWLYEDFRAEVSGYDKHVGEDNWYLVVGSAGLWYGRSDGGFVCQGLDSVIQELMKQDVWDVKFRLEEDGYLWYYGYHHDGTNSYAIIPLNHRADAVIEKAKREYEDLVGNRDLNDKLNNKYYIGRFDLNEFYI